MTDIIQILDWFAAGKGERFVNLLALIIVIGISIRIARSKS